MPWVDLSVTYVTPLLEQHLDFIQRAYATTTDVVIVSDEVAARSLPHWNRGRPGATISSRRTSRDMVKTLLERGDSPVSVKWLSESRRGRVQVWCAGGMFLLDFTPGPPPRFEYAPGSLTETEGDRTVFTENAEHAAEEQRERAERERRAFDAGHGLFGVGPKPGLGPSPLWHRSR